VVYRIKIYTLLPSTPTNIIIIIIVNPCYMFRYWGIQIHNIKNQNNSQIYM